MFCVQCMHSVSLTLLHKSLALLITTVPEDRDSVRHESHKNGHVSEKGCWCCLRWWGIGLVHVRLYSIWRGITSCAIYILVKHHLFFILVIWDEKWLNSQPVELCIKGDVPCKTLGFTEVCSLQILYHIFPNRTVQMILRLCLTLRLCSWYLSQHILDHVS